MMYHDSGRHHNGPYLAHSERLTATKKIIQNETALALSCPGKFTHDIEKCPYCPSWMEVYQLFCPSYYSLLGIDVSESMTDVMLERVIANFSAKQARAALPRFHEQAIRDLTKHISEGVIDNASPHNYVSSVKLIDELDEY